MLYHYFGNKEDLFRGIFDRKLVQRAAWLTEAPPDLGASLAYWFEMACEDSDWIRLVQWEALGMADQPVIREDERRASFARALGDLRARQQRGLLPADLDAGHLLLAIMGLVAYPLAFPQLTRMVTGRSAADPVFRAERAEFLRRFAAALTGRRPGPPRERPRDRAARPARGGCGARGRPAHRRAAHRRATGATPRPPRACRPPCR